MWRNTERESFYFVVGIGLVTLVAMSTGCANLASFQTAEVVEEGDRTAGVGTTFTRYSLEGLGFTDEDEEDPYITVQALMGWYRHGVTDGLELRVAAWFPFGYKVGVKAALLDEAATEGEGLQLAVGADVGHISVGAGAGDTSETGHIIDIYVPFYTGYRFSSSFAAYVTPQYIARVVTAGGETDFGHTGGGTVGMAIGENTEVHLEATGGYDFLVDAPAFTVGAGLAF